MKERSRHLDIDVTEEILCKLRETQCFATKIIQKLLEIKIQCLNNLCDASSR